MTSALVGSLLLALTLVPLLCLVLLRGNLPHGDNALVRTCKRFYTPALDWAIERPKTVLAGSVTALVLALGLPWERAFEAVRFSLGWDSDEAEVAYVLDLLPRLLARIRDAG